MFSLRGLLFVCLVLLLCSHASTQITSEARIISKNYTLPYTYPALYHVSEVKVIDNAEDSFAFLACQEPDRNVHQSCNLTVETWTLPNVPHKNTCENISITKHGEEGFFYFTDELWPVTPSRVIILSKVFTKNATESIPDPSTSKLQLAIVDVPTCSVVAKLKFSAHHGVPQWHSDLIVYRDSFEVILYGADECREQQGRCRISYDLDGRRIGDPKPYEVSKKEVTLPVSEQISDKGYYAISADSHRLGKIVISYIDPSGRAKELKSNISLTGEVLIDRSLSHANELFTICWLYSAVTQVFRDYLTPYSNRVRCLQFDTQALRMNLTVELPHNTTWLATRNLADGDLLLAVSNCEISSEGPNCKGIRVQRIAADGKQKYKALDVDGLQIKSDSSLIQVQITEKSNGEFCLFWSWKKFAGEYVNLNYKTWCAPTNSTLIQKQK